MAGILEIILNGANWLCSKLGIAFLSWSEFQVLLMKEWDPQKLLNLWTFFQLWLKRQDFHLWTNVLNQVMISNCVRKEKVWHHYLRYSFWTSIPWFIDFSALMFAIVFNLISQVANSKVEIRNLEEKNIAIYIKNKSV